MAVGNSIAKRSNNAAANTTVKFQSVIKSANVQENITATLGDVAKTKRFTASLISAVSNNKDLSNCDAVSIISAALLGESLNLSPSPQLGNFYMVPFGDKNSDVKKAVFQLGYKGYIQLAIRSGQYKRLNVVAVKAGELVKYDPFDEEIIVHAIEDPDEREQAETIGYYAMFELVNGFKKTMYWSKQKMIVHADKYSQAFSKDAVNTTKFKKVSFYDFEEGKYPKEDEWKYSSFWYKDFDGMAYKTMLRQLISKWGIMSIEMQSAFTNDMSFRETLDQTEAPKYTENDALEADVNERAVNLDAETGEVIEPATAPTSADASQNVSNEPVQESLV